MTDQVFPQSGLPIRRTVELLPTIFRSEANDKFMSAVVDPLVQPGKLQKLTGYIGRRYGKTYTGSDVYLDDDATLRSRYQLEPGVITKNHDTITSFYDYIDFKNQLKFFGNQDEHDNKTTSQEHYSWNPPIDWDKFVNYREYFWEPSGPPPVAIAGQKASIISTYKVKLGTQSAFIFTPDGYTNNPSIILYRGQTYKFVVNVPEVGFAIRTNYDTGSLIYNPNRTYTKGQLVVYDNKLWRAVEDVITPDGSSITIDSQDWQFVENISIESALDYNKGVTNNGIESGTITFKVPYDAPDLLFYQSPIDPDSFGRFIIADIESATTIDVEKEVIGKQYYLSSNGVELTNGLVIEFLGQVTPSKYAQDTWLVEGVGKAIRLTKFNDLIVPILTTDVPEVTFDEGGFDTQPFDDAAAYPGLKDYVTINRASADSNPWSRYNRWFHRSVLEYAYRFRGQDYTATEASRAKRPIIEFHPDIQLYNHGTRAKPVVDYLDDYTDDVFSKIEGSLGYNIDGEDLFEGARILVVADTDGLANNKIYQVQFINHNNRRQIHLAETADSDSVLGDCVLVRRGNKNGGLMFHYDGTVWKKSQEKTGVNQAPLYDAYDKDGVSFSDQDTYPTNTFNGSRLLGYKIGTGVNDKELGFPLSYLNIDNIGDIQFDWDWDTQEFTYTLDQQFYTKKISTGFYRTGDELSNGWELTSLTYIQPIIDSLIITVDTNTLVLTNIDWRFVTDNTGYQINFYVNDQKISDTWTRDGYNFVFDRIFKTGEVVTVKLITEQEPFTGYYEIPVGLEKNPLNQDLTSFTLGQAINHVSTALEFDERFEGSLPGVSNLRDLSDFQQNAKRFMKHSGLSPLAINLLCDKKFNIIKSIQYAEKSYTEFKNNFLNRAAELNYNENLVDFVDDIIADITKTKTSESPWADSDMIGAGAYTSINYTVEDTGIKTFALTEKFSLTELSRRAVYVYINGKQLLNTRDYTFNDIFGFVTINKDVSEGDEVEIREYVSTASNHIPPTPTAMGLYKKYTPMKFIDDTYREPREVIQGHDGSITAAFGDFRDDLLLELEYRIYNNIKVKYDESVFDIDAILGGYYGNAFYNKQQLDDIVTQNFLKWIQNTNIDYTSNSYFIENESFTYTYSNMTDPTGQVNLPGYWRGVYQWFYDTDRPHRCPWEMLGFSEQPTWWENRYGPAPYTRNNLILWEDLRDGIIREGERAGTYDRYKRPTLMGHIPTDGDGNLLSPLDSGLANDFVLINNRGPFALGDVGPVEYAWRSSSEWPFAVIIAMCLMKPFEFITDSFDRSRTKTNLLGQVVNLDTDRFITLDDIVVPTTGGILSSGLVQYLTGYIRSRGYSVTDFESQLKSIDVALSSRLSGFVDKGQQRYLLDSKSPKSASSSIFVPPENYDIIFNVSAPVGSVTYSGVLVEKTDSGWVVRGYDDVQPYFNYFEPLQSNQDPVISVGGVSESFTEWTANLTYNNGALVKYQTVWYRALQTHKSGDNFDNKFWKKLPKVPTIGAVEAFYRKNFNTLTVKRVSYGTEFNTIQQVVDFLLGYEAYLKSLGFIFNRYDSANAVSQDWLTSCKEFMFWTKHNWAIGAIITLSPAAEKVEVTVPVGVADSVLDGFYDYQILKGDGKPLTPQFINVNRSFQKITVETTNTTDGIYYVKFYYVLKEHVTVFDDRTVFNDVIYDKATGYRQDRIRCQGFRTIDWDGDYTSPGFLFDNVNIQIWQPFTDYRLGDIVAYRSYNWVSLQNQLGTETFDETFWTKLDSTPEKQLVANFDYKINQIEDFFDVASEGIGASQRDLARHTVGYQTRDYLQNLAEDSVTQFQLYQGFIREKGTNNAITKVFNKLSRSGSGSVILNEEWAFRAGRFGGLDQTKEIEFNLIRDELVLNPQTVLVENTKPATPLDRYYRVTKTDFTVEPIPYDVDVNPTSYLAEPRKVAGYPRPDQVEFSVRTRDDILDLDIAKFYENDHVWITFDSYTWTVLRYNKSPVLQVQSVEKTTNTVLVTLNRLHNIVVDDIVGFKNIFNLTGFYKVTAVGLYTITVSVDQTIDDPELDASTVAEVYLFTEARFESYNELIPQQVALLKNGSKLYIDNKGDEYWEVIEKRQQYSAKDIVEYGATSPIGAGYKVLYDDRLKLVFSSIPALGFVMTYREATDGLVFKQIIGPQDGYNSNSVGSFGKAMALSPDSRFLIIGSPEASGIVSHYHGPYNPSQIYYIDDIVLYAGKLWKCINQTLGDGSSIDIRTQDWEPATILNATPNGRGISFTEQGYISVYEFVNQQWEIVESFISPRPENYEFFGSEITIGQDGNDYYMAVSAPGSLDSRGRVYLYKYESRSFKRVLSAEIITDGEDVNSITNPGYVGYTTGDIVTVEFQGQSARFTVNAAAGKVVTLSLIDSDLFRFTTDNVLLTTVSPQNGRGLSVRLIYETVTEPGWRHIENTRYRGVYDATGATVYNEGDIVWNSQEMWQCLSDGTVGDGSTLNLTSNDWIKIDPISTQSSLPTNISIEDDGSTLSNLQEEDVGLVGTNQLAELIKLGDKFGSSLTMSRDGSVLVVGAPNADGQYFTNYKGMWRPDVEYTEGDVVKYDNIYYRLIDTRLDQSVDSTVRSFNDDPQSLPWEQVGDSTSTITGKVFVYQRSVNGTYELKQTITADSIAAINDLDPTDQVINTGDLFGQAMDIDYSGTTLIVSSPRADINFQNQGSAYVFRTAGLANIEYRLKQKLESFEEYPNEFFGTSISITPGAEKVAIGAKNAPFVQSTRFDPTLGTTFDQGRTRYSDIQGFAGGVYVFEIKNGTYFLVEKLEARLSPFESFGSSVDASYNAIVVGSPDYREPISTPTTLEFTGPKVGMARLFRKTDDVNSWETIALQEPVVDLSKIRSIELYDVEQNIKIQDLDYVDHAKLKILNVAEQELAFKTPYDPAVYSVGTDETIVDPTQAWREPQIGMLWWDLSTAKWLHYEQGEVAYRAGSWNTLAEGASIDIYEWVESLLLPNEWSALADTNEGLAEGISGQPLYPNNDVYSVKEIINPTTGLTTETLYYYWVKNKAVTPPNMPGRRIPSSTVASYITNPLGSGIAFVSLIDSNKFLLHNVASIIPRDQAVLNIQYYKNEKPINDIHTEYQLLTEGVADSVPNETLEIKWIDSLAGSDRVGNKVPDDKLPAKQQYGIQYRPRQSMFIDRLTAVKITVNNINVVLAKEPFADLINFDNLNSYDEIPASVLNLYDTVVDGYIDLSAVGTTRLRQAILQVNIIDGQFDTVDIIEPGFGYKVVPPVEIEGDGIGARVELTLDNQGRVASATVIQRGKNYSSAIAKVRQFSVLVNSDSTARNFWSIYAWDNERKVFYRSRSQSFDTRRYWGLIDWWAEGYNSTSRIVREIINVAQEPTISVEMGDLIRIKEYGSGGWAVFEKISSDGTMFTDSYMLVGREKGTVKISEDLFRTSVVGIGFDNVQSYDTVLYDIENAIELRNILKAVKEDVFIGDYKVEWNKLFFSNIRFAFSEQQYIDWAFKTSFLNATHNVGSLETRLNYRNDNLGSFQDYIEEVKPYRTTVREYVSRYDSVEQANAATTDFDLPPTYSAKEGRIVTVSESDSEISSYPWRWWAENNGYSIISINVYDTGESYLTVPKVLIEGGGGIGAVAQAYISNGRVSGVQVLSGGTGYTSSPTITLVGGNPAGSRKAKAVAILGDSKVRSFDLTVKFDRLSKTGIYSNFVQIETFTATGATASFDLNYAPSRDKSKITVLRNSQLVLENEYTISLYMSTTDTYGLLKGKLVFNQLPPAGDIIEVTYEKNDELLDAVNRIEKFYSPASGMKGDDLNQLMTGIDFGGVQIQGTTFDVTGGWDALPWFTDNWDSVESSADYYHVCDGSTTDVTLPFTPAEGQQITIYLKRAGQGQFRDIMDLQYEEEISPPPTVRIDDPAYTDNWDSTSAINPNAQMPTFVGDGSTTTVEIGIYIQTNAGDILIFRPIESDGSVTITDPNLLDTYISGGSLSTMSGAYATAAGITAEEIIIEGGAFVSPDHVPAPEENIPGQVLDSVSIKVFNSTVSGASPLQSKIVTADGITRIYDIGLNILNNSSVIVYVDKVKKERVTDYAINFNNNTIEFTLAPTAGSIIEIIAFGIGGVQLLDYREFIADGQTGLFLTGANYASTSAVYVTVNGEQYDAGFVNSTGIVDAENKTLVRFGINPAFNDVIKIICLGATTDVDSTGYSIVRVNTQRLEYEGSTRRFKLDNFVNLARASATSAILVEANGAILRGVDTTYVEYDGVTTSFEIGTDPNEAAGAILLNNVKVFVNQELKIAIQDYVFDSVTKILTYTSPLEIGDIIKIENNLRADYEIIDDEILIKTTIPLTYGDETTNDYINVTWFSEYPSMSITTDEYTGGKLNYNLTQTPLNISYVWVYKTTYDESGNVVGSVRLTQDQDFQVILGRNVVYLKSSTTSQDRIKIVVYGSSIFRLPSAYEIHKDMLNVYHFKRYAAGDVKLTKPLNYYDTTVEVSNGASLTDPVPSKNIAGIVEINGERIEYLQKSGNVLSQLRRGAYGTPIGETYPADSIVVDIGVGETLPYAETQEREDFVSDGSSLLIGPLPYVPTESTRNNWTRISIPDAYGPCDVVEVFAGGRRLRKDPVTVYDEALGASSPAADKVLEAEFSVDGTSAYIRLTSPEPAGTRITIIKRTGKTWYDRGLTTASDGKSLLENSTPIAKFIADKSTKLPE